MALNKVHGEGPELPDQLKHGRNKPTTDRGYCLVVANVACDKIISGSDPPKPTFSEVLVELFTGRTNGSLEISRIHKSEHILKGSFAPRRTYKLYCDIGAKPARIRPLRNWSPNRWQPRLRTRFRDRLPRPRHRSTRQVSQFSRMRHMNEISIILLAEPAVGFTMPRSCQETFVMSWRHFVKWTNRVSSSSSC